MSTIDSIHSTLISKTYWVRHQRLQTRAGKRCGSSSRLSAASPHGTSPADLVQQDKVTMLTNAGPHVEGLQYAVIQRGIPE